MNLRRIKVKNYRSLRAVEIGGIENLAAFIGKNMCGKSNLFDCIVFISEGAKDNFQTAIKNRESWNEIVWRKSETEISIELEFELKEETRNDVLGVLFKNVEGKKYVDLLKSDFLTNVIYSLKFKIFDSKRSFSEDLIIKNKTGGQSLIVQKILSQRDNQLYQKASDLVKIGEKLFAEDKLNINLQDGDRISWNNGEFRLLFYELTLREKPEFEITLIKKVRDYIERIKWLKPFKQIENKKAISGESILSYDAANLADVIHSISSNNPDKFNEFKKEVIKVLPGISNLLSPVEVNSSTVGLKETQQLEDESYKLSSFSSGVKNVLAILTLLILTKEKSLILIEEPETHLHPSAIRNLMEIIMKYSGDTQVFFSTHSPCTLLNFKIENIYLVKRNTENNTIINKSSYLDIDSIIEELGILPSDFFNRNVLLFVEGPYDIVAFEAFLSKMRGDFNNICLISLDGWTKIKYQVNAKVIKELQVKPKLFAILDGDIEKRPKEKKQLDNLKKELSLPEENIYTLQKGEIETYLLDAEAWFKTWPELIDRISKDKLEERFNKIIQSSNQKEDMKSFMSELDLGQFTEKVARTIAENIDKIPEDIKNILEKITK